ncbi:MAG: DUF5717 family protein [Eubacteriales bacterium]|nr:DUF5717 family protein [Eubacteriales bacterium]
MKEIIGRLSKGISDIEAPAISVLPESFCDTVLIGSEPSFIIELLSTNGYGIKGICFSDEPRFSVDMRTFVGRRIHLNIRIDTSGLEEGDTIEGSIFLATNGGEFAVPYAFDFVKTSAAGKYASREVLSEAGSSEADEEYIIESPVTARTVSVYELQDGRQHDLTETEGDPEELDILCSFIPEDEPLFRAILSEMIRACSYEPLSFCFYREAVSRGIRITRLYESFVHAFPEDCDDPMPREVLLYFSYERDPELEVRRKIYRNILMNQELFQDLFFDFGADITGYAMSCALSGNIDRDLAIIYDRIISPDMIDRRAAKILPDIFKCCRITVENGEADTVVVSYPELKGGVRASIYRNEAYVPVYFKNAVYTFYRDEPFRTEVTSEIRYSSESLFDRPDILRCCFEQASEHRMLLLSAVKEIAARGVISDNEIKVLARGLEELPLRRSFRNDVIKVLCGSNADILGLSVLTQEDYHSAAGGSIFKAFLEEGRYLQAYDMLKLCGHDKVPEEELSLLVRKMLEPDNIGIIREYLEAQRSSEYETGFSDRFTGICMYLYRHKAADDSIVKYLTDYYEGSSEVLFGLMQEALSRGLGTGRLPEMILTIKLFSRNEQHIDEVFETYIRSGDYTETLVRAYFTVRCNDSFVNEKETGETLFEALDSYAQAVSDPAGLPVIFRLALTKYYSGLERLGKKQTAICQELSDSLIRQGLIFCYTKKLRKKIHIPDEIFRKFFVEYHASGDAPPKMLALIAPDDEEYHVANMRRVYKNIYVMSVVLFKGDELRYLIYDSAFENEPSEEGIISVKKYHRQKDDLFESLNMINKAIEEKDIETLKERMLDYAGRSLTIRELFSMES